MASQSPAAALVAKEAAGPRGETIAGELLALRRSRSQTVGAIGPGNAHLADRRLGEDEVHFCLMPTVLRIGPYRSSSIPETVASRPTFMSSGTNARPNSD